MNAKLRASIYILAASIGAVAIIYGWATNDEVDAWMRVIDSVLNVVMITAPLLALKHLTPDAPKAVEGEIVEDVA